ncbi:SubName: Full=Related to myotubularin related protein 1 {ECO:0000313/EMBL:CCA68449.1} [Serendipita indica DSM 11827]|nr:SubName: Full=Related to myotubularin related protein 1 {ECO:0000313/EMBL:CCA68449.1} [Serendipita indica DSM 11827]
MTTSALSQVPPEIWEIIHKYCISVPLFFETDPAVHGVDSLVQYYSEVAYWHSERTRNAMRRVCKSWNIALDTFRHRYIRLSDVAHGRVPLEALPLAIRIFLEPYSFCQCKEVCYPERRVFGEARWMSIKTRMARMLVGATTASHAPWKLEILEGQLQIPDFALERLANVCPRLRTLTQRSCAELDKYQQLVPHTQMLLMDGDWAEGCAITGGLKLPNLTTLLLRGEMQNFCPEEWSIPSLLHLHLDIFGLVLGPGATDLLSRILGCWGLHLRTLTISCESDLRMPNSFWSLVPRVREVQLPFIWTLDPPVGHPLRVVRLSESLMAFAEDFSEIEPRLPLQGAIEDDRKSSIRRIALHESWHNALLFHPQLDWDIYTRLERYCSERRWRFTDRFGSTLSDYILRLIASTQNPPERYLQTNTNPRRLMSF